MTSLDLSRLRQTAEAATPGPWHVTHDPLGTHVENGDGVGRIVHKVGSDRVGPAAYNENDAEFIATFDPVLALELLNRIERLTVGIKALADEWEGMRPVWLGAGSVVEQLRALLADKETDE